MPTISDFMKSIEAKAFQDFAQRAEIRQVLTKFEQLAALHGITTRQKVIAMPAILPETEAVAFTDEFLRASGVLDAADIDDEHAIMKRLAGDKENVAPESANDDGDALESMVARRDWKAVYQVLRDTLIAYKAVEPSKLLQEWVALAQPPNQCLWAYAHAVFEAFERTKTAHAAAVCGTPTEKFVASLLSATDRRAYRDVRSENRMRLLQELAEDGLKDAHLEATCCCRKAADKEQRVVTRGRAALQQSKPRNKSAKPDRNGYKRKRPCLFCKAEDHAPVDCSRRCGNPACRTADLVHTTERCAAAGYKVPFRKAGKR